MGKVAILLTVDKKRDGNEADVERLLPILEECGYGEIINKREATKQDMIDTLRDLQKRDNLHSVTKDYHFESSTDSRFFEKQTKN